MACSTSFSSTVATYLDGSLQKFLLEIYHPIQSAGFDKSVGATYVCMYVYVGR